MSLLRDAAAVRTVADADRVEVAIDEALKADPGDKVARDALHVLVHKREIIERRG